MEKCKKCGDYLFSWQKECNCKEFLIIDEDGEEHTVRAAGEEAAALRYARESNEEGDYYLMDGEVEIEVNGEKYWIHAEPDVSYSAGKVK